MEEDTVSIELNMYQGHMMTAKDDAVVYEPMLGGNGILYGCEINFLGANQVTIGAGDGVIKGRKFTILEETINVQLPEEDGRPGRIYIRMDLSNSEEPIKILSCCKASSLPDLEQDENCNHNNGIYEIELATYTGNRSAITGLVTTYSNVSAKMSEVIGDIKELKKSVSDGKSGVASAITIQGVPTDEDATFAVLKQNVLNIPKGKVWTSSPQDLSKQFPGFYKRLTSADFICGSTNNSATSSKNGSHYGQQDSSISTSTAGKVSYNPDTGILSFSHNGNSADKDCGDYVHHRISISNSGVFCAYKGTIGGE